MKNFTIIRSNTISSNGRWHIDLRSSNFRNTIFTDSWS